MERKNRIPITRLSRYYDDVDFQYDLEAAEEIINEDAGFTVVLFRIDRNHSNIDDIYGESDTRDIRFLAPVELRVILKLEDAENKTYGDNGSLRYQEHGNLIFDILNKELDDKGVEIGYGDIVGYAMTETDLKYFEVYDDGKINVDNESTMYGFRSFFSTIRCTTVDPNRFNGI
jgi:hypothetical protein